MALPSQQVAALRTDYQSLEQRIRNASDRDEALDLAIKAAQLCIDALKIAADQGERSALRSKAESLLNQVESIRDARDWHSEAENAADLMGNLSLASPTTAANQTALVVPKRSRRLQAPTNTRLVTNQEQILVLRASKFNGFKFPPWKAPSDKRAPLTKLENEPELRLSSVQRASFKCWAPAEEALPPPAMDLPLVDRPELTMHSTFPMDLVQDVTSDCSVVASLCAVAAREERGHPTILGDILLPFDDETDKPMISPNGVYHVCLNFNGSQRCVAIDDKLPVSNTERLLHVVDRNCSTLLWPALLEKAYLTVRGGYDFPGSNSCTDLWVLTGWIPEQIILGTDELDIHKLWPSIHRAFTKGDVLVTLGTAQMSKEAEKALRLASEHSYAVVDMMEENGRTLLQLKNPWCVDPSWTENASANQQTTERDNGSDLLDFDDSQASPPTSPAGESQGIFWMDLDSVLQEFHSVYLNWNPGLFSHRSDIHFTWKLEQTRRAGSNFVSCPQFSVGSEKAGRLWLLLCRHFGDRPQDSNEESLIDPSDEAESPRRPRDPDAFGFICLYAFDRNGNRVRATETYVKKAQYIDSAQVLLQLEMPANKTYTIAASEQQLKPGQHNFSLIAFSSTPIVLELANDQYPHTKEVSSAWTASSAGGRDEQLTHLSNPQFKLTVTAKTNLALLLEVQQTAAETGTSPISVNVKLLHSDGKRVTKLTSRDIIANSGAYTPSAAHAEVEHLEKGSYTIICSAWAAGQEAKFALRADSTAPCELRQLPAEHAGRFLVNNLPRPSFGPTVSSMCAPLQILHPITLTAVARHHSLVGGRQNPAAAPPPRSPVRLSLQIIAASRARGAQRRSSTTGTGTHVLAASCDGDWDDAAPGVRVDDVSLWPAMHAHGDELWLVLDRLRPPLAGGTESFRIELLVDGVRGRDWNLGYWREAD